jgi:hypothetical protein
LERLNMVEDVEGDVSEIGGSGGNTSDSGTGEDNDG